MADGTLIFDTSINTDGFKSAFGKLGKIGGIAKTGITAMGASMGAAIGAASTALVGLGGAAIKVGTNFESSMSQVAATMGISTEEIANGSKEFDILHEAAKKAGETTKFSASESAEALNYLALAGYDAQKAAEALPSVLNLAAAGGMDLAYASDLATDAMAALGIEATQDNLTEFGDKMSKAAQKSNTSVSQLGEAILVVGGTAKSLAGGTTELNTALGVLANRGIKGAEGGTALRNVILSLSAPTDKAAGELAKLGVSAFDAEGKMRPLNEVFKDLDGAMSGLTEEEKTQALSTIFNKVDIKSAQALLAGCGEEFDNLADAIENSGGAMQEMADTQLDNLEGDITILKSALEGLGIAAYESEFQTAARGIVQQATEMVGELNTALSEGGLDGFVSKIGGMAAEVVTEIAEYTPMIIDAGVNAVTSFISGISENVGAIIDAAISIGTSLLNGIMEILPALAEAGGQIIIAIKDKLVENLPELIPAALQMLINFADYVISHIGDIVSIGIEIIGAIVEGIVNSLPLLIAEVPRIINDFWDEFDSNLFKLIAAGAEMIVKLVKGLIDNIPLLIANLPAIADAIITTLSHINLFNVGKNLVTNLGNGLKSTAGTLSTAAKDLVNKILHPFKNTKAFSDIGKNAVSGIVSGLKNAGSALVSAAKGLGTSLITNLKNILGIHSPSRVMRKMFETDFANGIVLGIKNGEDRVDAAIRAMGESAIKTARENSDDYESLGKNYVELMKYGIDSQKEKLIDSVEDTINGITEANKKSDAKEEYSEAGKSVMEAYKTAIENGADEAKELIEEKVTAITSEWQKQRDAILKEQEAMQNKLASYGDLFTYDDDDNMVLGKIEDNIKALEKYDETLSALKERGLSDGLMDKITSMSVEEGTAYAEKLLSLNENQFKTYTENWEKQQQKAREIAEKFYATELETLDREYSSKLDNALADIPKLVKDIGVNTIKGLTDGMLSEKSNAVSTARSIADAVKSELQGAFDIYSPSRWAKNIIGKNIMLGMGEGVIENVPAVKADIADSIDALSELKNKVGTEKYGTSVTSSPVREISNITEKQTTVIEREKVAKIEFTGRLKDVARVLKPKLDVEDNRVGKSFVNKEVTV